MADFDPDAFLAGTQPSSGGFDPDAFLAGSQPSYAMKTSTGYPEPQAVDQPQSMTAGPTPEDLMSLYGGYGTGKLVGAGISGISSLFQKTPTLLNAGIKATTLAKMTPEGMNPADFGAQLQNKLVSAGAISGNPADSWNGINNFTQKAGKGVEMARDAIAQAAGPGALNVNGEVALQPIYDAWGKEVNALVPDGRTINTFGKYYSALANTAQQNGGNLSLDDIHDFLQEIGPKTHTGAEVTQDIYSKLYSAGMDAQDSVINTVAKQANNPALAQNLLNANNDYSIGMRLMPDVTKASAAVPLKESVSTAQRLWPWLERGAVLGAGYQTVSAGLKRLLGQ